MNIFQIWESIGKVTPFAVRRNSWNGQYYTIVEKIECDKMPYGKAFGFPVANGKRSDHYTYDKHWRKEGLIPAAGTYQWQLVEGVDINVNQQP